MKWWSIGILLLNSFILKAQTITTFAGCGSCGIIGDGGPAIDAAVLDPNGGVFDKYGNYYFTDNTGARVRKVSTAGIITTVAGTGSSGFAGDGGLATAALLSSPTTVILDTFGNLYIADANNERIRKVNITTGIINTICGNGTGAYYGDGGPAIDAELWGPDDICFDKYDNLYIADYVNQRVRKIDTSGIITTFAGSGGFSATGTGDGGPATSATFDLISGVVADDIGNIYIADYNGGKVRKVDTFGIITTIAGNGTPTYSGDGIPATSAQIAPGRLGFDKSEHLYIADKYNLRVLKIDSSGIIHSIAGDGMTGFSGDGGPATAATIYFPFGIAFDACGNLYVPDVNNRRVRKIIFDSTGVPSVTISGNDTVCAGASVTYTATVTNGYGVNYQWYVDGISAGATSSAYTYLPANGDSVRCVLIATSQCSGDTETVSSNTINMTVTPITTPTITLTAPASAAAGSVVTVTATVANASGSYSINWYDDGVLFASTTTPTVTYTMTAETESITATVIPSSGGCYDSAASAVHVITPSNEGVVNVAAQVTGVYPNPVHNSVNIDNVQTLTGYRLLDIIGAVLQAGTLQKGNNSIDIQALAPGIYLLEIVDGEGKTVHKIMKQ